MSIAKEGISVRCDVCRGHWGGFGGRYAAEARREAKREGWQRKTVNGKKLDVCPSCQRSSR